jgi:hypothetical protein
MFSIDFIQSSSRHQQLGNIKVGEIVIRDFREVFHSSLSYWDAGQYLNQWREGISRMCVDRLSSSVIITDMYDPNSSNVVQWWTLHRHQDIVSVRNEIVFLIDLPKNSFEDNIYQFVEKRPSNNQNDERISEWKLNIAELSLSF